MAAVARFPNIVLQVRDNKVVLINLVIAVICRSLNAMIVMIDTKLGEENSSGHSKSVPDPGTSRSGSSVAHAGKKLFKFF